MGKWRYSRLNNIIKLSLERLLAQIKGGKYTLIFSAGLAGIMACIELLKSGDEIISINDLYEGTQSNFRDIMVKHHGVNVTFFGFKDLNKFKQLLNPNVKMVFIESPTNPNMTVVDIPEVSKIIKEYSKNIILVVDNIFLSPINFKQLERKRYMC